MFGYDSRMLSGTNKGSGDVAYNNTGEFEVGEGDTYILEGRINKVLLGSSFGPGTDIMLSLGYSASDSNEALSKRYFLSTAFSDRIVLAAGIQQNGVIPEPSPILLFGAGFLGTGFFRRKRAKR